MEYIFKEDSIDKLHMSKRAQNALYRMGTHNVESFLLLTEDTLKGVRSIGKKTEEEILNTINELKNDTGERKLLETDASNSMAELNKIEAPMFRNQDGKTYYDIPLVGLGLSLRACNCLIKAGYKDVSELLNLSMEKLLSIKSMGIKSASEIFNMVANMNFEEAEIIELSEEDKLIESYCENYITLLNSKHIHVPIGLLYPRLQEFFREYCAGVGSLKEGAFAENTHLMEQLYEIDVIRNAVKQRIVYFLELERYGLPFSYLQGRLFGENSNVCQGIVNEMFKSNILNYAPNGNIENNCMSVIEYGQTIEGEKESSLFLGRINGETLEELGKKYDITRERVRQILIRVLEKRPRLKADFYAEVFQNYFISQEDFMFGFGEMAETYNFLAMAYSIGKEGIPSLIEDKNYSSYFRKIAEKIVYRDYLSAGDERIKCNRPDLVDYVIRTYCYEDTDFNSFLELYDMFLEDYGLDNDEKFILNSRSYENRLSGSRIVLWKQWKRFRYYNIEEKDFDELFQTLALEQYQDVEYSSYKFYVEYPELMKYYDIHDEYELHNLLKKLYVNRKNDYIKFKKMPMIEFGVGDRDNQVLELLLQYAPIANNELAKKYEEEYGVRAETVLANALKNFDDYFFNGIYSIDAEPLPGMHLNRMKEVLNQDFYTVSEVKRIYLLEYPDADVYLINPYTLKTMGFKVYSGYVIKNIYISVAAYFRNLLTDKDIVDISGFQKAVLGTLGFTGELSRLRSTYEIIEFASSKYINIRRLNSAGITKEMLYHYSEEVAEFVEQGEYFTIFSLKNAGFKSDLDELGFEHCFYGSLLAEGHKNFSYRRMGKTKMFVKGNYDISLKNFIIHVVDKEEKIDIYSLVDLLEEKYYVKIDKDTILTQIKDSSLYYDSIMEKVYINYDIYFEEV